jgi:hypothetical protein
LRRDAVDPSPDSGGLFRVRLQLQKARVGRRGLRPALQPPQHEAQVVEGFGVPRIAADGLLQRCDGFFSPAQVNQDHAEIIVAQAKAGVSLHALLIRHQCVFQFLAIIVIQAAMQILFGESPPSLPTQAGT